jgi:4-amino-4-deoxy-L-arabinose transferase-like glycosyltransferase
MPTMTAQVRTRVSVLLAGLPLLYTLYFFGLTNAGMLGPDEPRYAAIGREMARTGDWITPRLWGEPWFEKPALLYWMTGTAFRFGLNEDLSPRLPIALLSAAFLIFFYWILRREFGHPAAVLSTAVLATTAGWLGLSRVGVADLPMSAVFAAAMLLALRWLDRGDRTWLPLVAALLGLAVLAKGLVPLVLARPLAWMGRKRWQDWLRPSVISAFSAVALPWYLLCFWRNGKPFLETFFWEHQFQRFRSAELAHGQPFWFFLPVLLAAIFPWTPLMVLLARRGFYIDSRRRFLALWLAFGFIFFSAATNKLPGYILPLVPAFAVLAGIALAEAKQMRWVLAASAALLVLIPPVAAILPRALASGISRSAWPPFQWMWLLPLIAAGVVWYLDKHGYRIGAVALLVTAVAASVALIEVQVFPAIDRLASARPLWRVIAPESERVCVERLHRSLRYGLNYYSVTPLPDCRTSPREVQITQEPGLPPRVVSAYAVPASTVR